MIAIQPSDCARGEALATYKVADQPWELRSAFRLVYEKYLQAGLIRPNASQMRVTPWHLLPTTEVLIATAGQQVLSTASIIRDGEMGIPMESVFPEEVASRRLMGVSFAEVSCLADRPAPDGRSFPLVRRLMALVIQTAHYRGVDRLLIVVHPRHGRFYERFLGFEPIGSTKSYHAVCDNPALPMELDMVTLPIRNRKAYRNSFGEEFSYRELQPPRVSADAYSLLNHGVRFYDASPESAAEMKQDICS